MTKESEREKRRREGGKEGKKNHTNAQKGKGAQVEGKGLAVANQSEVTYIRGMIIQLHVCLIRSVDSQHERVLERVDLLHVFCGDVCVSDKKKDEESNKKALGLVVRRQDTRRHHFLLS